MMIYTVGGKRIQDHNSGTFLYNGSGSSSVFPNVETFRYKFTIDDFTTPTYSRDIGFFHIEADRASRRIVITANTDEGILTFNRREITLNALMAFESTAKLNLITDVNVDKGVEVIQEIDIGWEDDGTGNTDRYLVGFFFGVSETVGGESGDVAQVFDFGPIEPDMWYLTKRALFSFETVGDGLHAGEVTYISGDDLTLTLSDVRETAGAMPFKESWDYAVGGSDFDSARHATLVISCSQDRGPSTASNRAHAVCPGSYFGDVLNDAAYGGGGATPSMQAGHAYFGSMTDDRNRSSNCNIALLCFVRGDQLNSKVDVILGCMPALEGCVKTTGVDRAIREFGIGEAGLRAKYADSDYLTFGEYKCGGHSYDGQTRGLTEEYFRYNTNTGYFAFSWLRDSSGNFPMCDTTFTGTDSKNITDSMTANYIDTVMTSYNAEFHVDVSSWLSGDVYVLESVYRVQPTSNSFSQNQIWGYHVLDPARVATPNVIGFHRDGNNGGDAVVIGSRGWIIPHAAGVTGLRAKMPGGGAFYHRINRELQAGESVEDMINVLYGGSVEEFNKRFYGRYRLKCMLATLKDGEVGWCKTLTLRDKLEKGVLKGVAEELERYRAKR